MFFVFSKRTTPMGQRNFVLVIDKFHASDDKWTLEMVPLHHIKTVSNAAQDFYRIKLTDSKMVKSTQE